MSPVLTPTLLDPIAETFELTETELGRLFGVSRQAVGQWRERGVPSNRMASVTTVAAIGDLLGYQLKSERIPGIARRPADAYGGLSMLEMIERGREDELLTLIRRSFDWTSTF
jgi:hypothetical protein